jgi:hypothetical protein
MIGDTAKILENDMALQVLIKEHRTARDVTTVTATTVTTPPTLETVTIPVPGPSVIELAKDDNLLSSVEVEVLSDIIEIAEEIAPVEV